MAGDSLLIGFGVPLPQADSAERAVRAACGVRHDQALPVARGKLAIDL